MFSYVFWGWAMFFRKLSIFLAYWLDVFLVCLGVIVDGFGWCFFGRWFLGLGVIFLEIPKLWEAKNIFLICVWSPCSFSAVFRVFFIIFFSTVVIFFLRGGVFLWGGVIPHVSFVWRWVLCIWGLLCKNSYILMWSFYYVNWLYAIKNIKRLEKAWLFKVYNI